MSFTLIAVLAEVSTKNRPFSSAYAFASCNSNEDFLVINNQQSWLYDKQNQDAPLEGVSRLSMIMHSQRTREKCLMIPLRS